MPRRSRVGYFAQQAEPDVSSHKRFYARGGYTGRSSLDDDMALWASQYTFAKGGSVHDPLEELLQYLSSMYAEGGPVGALT